MKKLTLLLLLVSTAVYANHAWIASVHRESEVVTGCTLLTQEHTDRILSMACAEPSEFLGKVTVVCKSTTFLIVESFPDCVKIESNLYYESEHLYTGGTDDQSHRLWQSR